MTATTATVLPVSENVPPVPLGCENAKWFVETRVPVGFTTCVERVGFTSKNAARRWAAEYNRGLLGKELAAAARRAN